MDVQRSRLLRRPALPVAFIAAALLALAGCGGGRHRSGEGSGSTAKPITNAAYESTLNSWVDHPEEDLVAAWGVPERSQRLTDGGQALQFVRTDSEGGILCTTLFTSDMTGMIRTWTYRGSACQPPRLGTYGPS
jgi:hypothetical protein